MNIFKEIAPLKAYLHEKKATGKSIGFVPTMGALHAGHLSLIEKSKSGNDLTVCSIYINPTQFNNHADLENYPRTLEKDTELLASAGCDVLFIPENLQMYEEPSTVTLHFGLLDRVMEGAFRPGHFSGVALIVSKLFHIIEPTHAYFGQKDWQQFAVIKRLVRELKFNLTLHSVPTLRETDGLAMSSRNMRLTTAHRENAKVFYHSLLKVQSMLQSGLDFEVAKKFAREKIEEKPGFALEYLELADSENLLPLKNVADSSKPILCIAGYAGDVRLIDNLLL